jgi:TRAP transporter 4TM/12TM fusion protein
MIPLTVMVTLLIMQFTPYLAAFWGIILTVICSYIPLVMKHLGVSGLDDSNTLTPAKLIHGLENGARSALAIGAACACVGFILGVITLTGMGFKFSGAVLQISTSLGNLVSNLTPFDLISVRTASLFFGLIMVAIACILMGTGIPTTPTYIILASIAGPALMDMNVPLLATHFFVFYYGVLADVTPPVALAAYAGAGIARSDPMKTGITAFKLSMGKGLVPFMFVYAPSMLLLNFTWMEFGIAMVSGILGIFSLSVAFTGHFVRTTRAWENVLLCICGLFLVGNHLPTILFGTLVGLLLLARIYLTGRRRGNSPVAA